jgi:hypothetical protein
MHDNQRYVKLTHETPSAEPTDSAGPCCVDLVTGPPHRRQSGREVIHRRCSRPEAHLPFEPLDLVAVPARIALEAIGATQLIAWSAEEAIAATVRLTFCSEGQGSARPLAGADKPGRG